MDNPIPLPHDTLVNAQFGTRAAAYVASAVHAQGEDLRELAALVAGANAARVLDLGCGGGHVAFAVAPHVAEVVAYDLSAEMLAAVAAEAAARGLGNVTTERGSVEALPFADGTFDAVVTRFSAHHWYDAPAGLREARRVLRTGGTAAFVDVVSPDAVALDTFLQSVELLRDPSHVRDYRVAEWRAMLDAAGFTVTRATERRLRMEFASWIARMQTPPVRRDAIRSLQANASAAVATHFAIEPDGSFMLDTLALEATTRPGSYA
jgi:ubiquinone/menaquinone biosynthesis C-methylase UbiE